MEGELLRGELSVHGGYFGLAVCGGYLAIVVGLRRLRYLVGCTLLFSHGRLLGELVVLDGVRRVVFFVIGAYGRLVKVFRLRGVDRRLFSEDGGLFTQVYELYHVIGVRFFGIVLRV